LNNQLDDLKNLEKRTKDELYGWTEREFPGTKQYTAALIELERRKKRDNWVRVVVGITIAGLLILLAWIRGWWSKHWLFPGTDLGELCRHPSLWGVRYLLSILSFNTSNNTRFSPERKVSMSQLRNEVVDLIRVSVTLLSPDSLGSPLTAEECSVVEFYAMSLLEEYRISTES
jgi:hypothetical protein